MDLIDGLDAEKLRTSPEAMRTALGEVAARGGGLWTGPLTGVVDALAGVGRLDLCLGRLLEGHVDALRILAEAPAGPRPGLYGVWASRSSGTGIRATRQAVGWRLSGELRFASGIDLVDRALTVAWPEAEGHLLVDLAADRVTAHPDSWRTPAMDAARSFTVAVEADVPYEDVVGPPGFYLNRPGFVVGGLCVAAVWAGGAQGVVDLVADGLREFSPTAHQLARVGRMELDAFAASRAVWHAAEAVAGSAGHVDVPEEVARARALVVASCDRVLAEVGPVVGPGGLSRNRRLARMVADLAIYVRQHHTDAEVERLGRDALAGRTVRG